MTTRTNAGWQDQFGRFARDTSASLCRQVSEQCPGPSVVHAGFCAHLNPGDNAISIAETRLLRTVRKRVVSRVSDVSMMGDAEAIAGRIRSLSGEPAIVLRGGGSLSPLYPEILRGYTELIRRFGDRPILIMPQSSYLDDGHESQEFVAAVRGHQRIRVLARDDRSFAELTKRTAADVRLAPDSVFTLGPLPRRRPRTKVRIAVVARQDIETAKLGEPMPSTTGLPWMSEPRAFIDPRLLPARLQHRWPVPGHPGNTLLLAAARGRTGRALSMVRSARLIVSDRLHAVILSLVAQTPVIAVDNLYGKVFGTIDTWDLTQMGPLWTAETFQDAERLSHRLYEAAERP